MLHVVSLKPNSNRGFWRQYRFLFSESLILVYTFLFLFSYDFPAPMEIWLVRTDRKILVLDDNWHSFCPLRNSFQINESRVSLLSHQSMISCLLSSFLNLFGQVWLHYYIRQPKDASRFFYCYKAGDSYPQGSPNRE